MFLRRFCAGDMDLDLLLGGGLRDLQQIDDVNRLPQLPHTGGDALQDTQTPPGPTTQVN